MRAVIVIELDVSENSADLADSLATQPAPEHQHADRWPCVCGATYDEWKAAQPAPEEGCSSCGLYGGGHAHPDCEGAQPAPEAATVGTHRQQLLADAIVQIAVAAGYLAPGLWCPTCGRERRDNGYGGCDDRQALIVPGQPLRTALAATTGEGE